MTSPMADKDLLALFDERMRADAETDEPGARVERVEGVVRQVGATAGDWHGGVYAQLDAGTADAAIAAQIAYFGGLGGGGGGFEWEADRPDEPAGPGARLSRGVL